MNSRKIFLSGATGFQGIPTAQLLLKRGYNITSLSKNLKQDDSVLNGVKLIQGGFEDTPALAIALKDVETAIFTLPLVFDMNQALVMVENFIKVAEEEKVGLVVFNTSFHLPKQKTGLLAIDLKVELKKRFDHSQLNVITLTPDVYIDNISAPWSLPLITKQEILPYPIKSGQKIPWISHSNLAQFIASAVEKPELAGQTLAIGGNLYSGEEIADSIGKKIGKTIHFIALSPNDFEKNLVPGFGEVAAREISNLYRFLDENIEDFVSKDYQSSQNSLGVKPQTLEHWINSIDWN